MKLILPILLLTMSKYSFCQALFAEANFSDMQYSALVKNISLEETDLGNVFSGFALFAAKVGVIDVYYGDLKAGDEIDVQINVAYIGRKHTLKNMNKPYILSFCKSEDGTYYTNRDFIVIPASKVNIKEFIRLKKEGTDFDGNHDCTSTNFDLKPVRIN